MYALATGNFNKSTRFFKKIYKDSNPFFSFLATFFTSIMTSKQVKFSRSSRGEAKKPTRAIAPISLEDMMDKEVLLSSQDGEIRELSVLSNPSNDKSTKIKQRIKILAHPKNLMEVLWARMAIEKGLIGNAITIGPNGFYFTRTFLEGEALRIFEH